MGSKGGPGLDDYLDFSDYKNRVLGSYLFLPGGPSLGALFTEGANVSLSLLQNELDLEKGLEMRKWVLSGILASEETYLSHLEALLLVSIPCWDSPLTSF